MRRCPTCSFSLPDGAAACSYCDAPPSSSSSHGTDLVRVELALAVPEVPEVQYRAPGVITAPVASSAAYPAPYPPPWDPNAEQQEHTGVIERYLMANGLSTAHLVVIGIALMMIGLGLGFTLVSVLS